MEKQEQGDELSRCAESRQEMMVASSRLEAVKMVENGWIWDIFERVHRGVV